MKNRKGRFLNVFWFLNVFLAALYAGGLLVFLMGPVRVTSRLDASQYVGLQQQLNDSLQPMMPALAISANLSPILVLVLLGLNAPATPLLVAGFVCSPATSAIGGTVDLPINGRWLPGLAPPSGWAEVRAWWGTFHAARTVTVVLALAFYIAAPLRKRQA